MSTIGISELGAEKNLQRVQQFITNARKFLLGIVKRTNIVE